VQLRCVKTARSVDGRLIANEPHLIFVLLIAEYSDEHLGALKAFCSANMPIQLYGSILRIG